MSYIIETPVYINTQFNYFCDHCQMCELTLKTETNTFKYDDVKEIKQVSYTITCKHFEVCKKLMHNLRYTQKAEDKEPEVKIK